MLGAYLLHTLGELCLSPVGLSVVTKLAPARFASLMMGTWLASSALANLVGGLFAGNYDTMDHVQFFMIPTATSAIAGLLLLILAKTHPQTDARRALSCEISRYKTPFHPGAGFSFILFLGQLCIDPDTEMFFESVRTIDHIGF